jgi:hypothetical protein
MKIEATLRLKASKYPPLRKPLPSEPQTYRVPAFHATLLDNWASIRSKGLRIGVSGPSAQDWKGKWSGKAVYFHLQFPKHELSNSVFDGQPTVLVIEVDLNIGAGYIVPDEDASLNPDDVPKIMKSKGTIAVGYPIPPNTIKAVHLPDLPAAHAWAKKNVGSKFKVVYHPV